MKIKILQSKINYTKTLIGVLFVFILIFMILYSYFMNMSVLNIVERKAAEKNILNISSEISNLEAEYFSKINNINIEFALLNGFEEVEKINFAYRKGFGEQVLSLNNPEL